MNPFREQSSSHSTWLVTLCIYNLPSWLCMKRKFIMTPVLIQGPRQPGNNIDVYLRPLVEELLLLWNRLGVCVWDEHKQEHFDLRAIDPMDLAKLQNYVVQCLVNFELVFPPSFFSIMTYLLVHLVKEISILGPCSYTTCFPLRGSWES